MCVCGSCERFKCERERERGGEKRWNEKLGVPSPAAALLLPADRLYTPVVVVVCGNSKKPPPTLPHIIGSHFFLFFFFSNLWLKYIHKHPKSYGIYISVFNITRAKFIVSIIRRLPNPSHRRLCLYRRSRAEIRKVESPHWLNDHNLIKNLKKKDL